MRELQISKVVSENTIKSDAVGTLEIISCDESLSRGRVLVTLNRGGLDPSTRVAWLDVRSGLMQPVVGDLPFGESAGLIRCRRCSIYSPNE